MSKHCKRQVLPAARCPRVVFTLMIALGSVQPQTAISEDRTLIALSAIEFGGSVGTLLWGEAEKSLGATQQEANRYTRLAYEVKEQIELGRASSSLIQKNFDLIGSTLAYSATVDPEPLSKSTAAVAAWASKKAGDALGNLIMEEFQKQAHSILAQGLKNSGLSSDQLRSMSPSDLRQKVAELKLGGQTLQEILKDDAQSLEMLQAHAVDIATNIGVEALALAKGTDAEVSKIKGDLAATKKSLTEYQEQVNKHLEKVETRLSKLESATQVAGEKLDALKKEVDVNTKAINTLAQVSYSGWTTTQKLQAVESGLFPDLTPTQQSALVESLKADQERERLVGDLQKATQDLGNLAAIVGNLGLPKDLMTGLQGAQTVAVGIAQFASGNVLGGVASLTSLAGLGAPDAAAERHAAMMRYLAQQFAVVNQKLDKIIDLQIQTLKAVATLVAEQQSFRREVLGQLDRIEDDVLRSERVLNAIMLSQWTDCHALIGGPVLNGQFGIPNQQILTGIIGDANARTYAAGCYAKMVGFLDAWVKPATWSGQIIAAGNFPTVAIADTPGLQKSWAAYQSQRTLAYTSAQTFILTKLPGAATAPAKYLARFAQPVVDAIFARKLDSLFDREDIDKRFSSFTCDQAEVLAPALKDLACFGLLDGKSARPKPNRWQDLISSALIGPHANGLVDTGITLSTIADFAWRDSKGTFKFVNADAVSNFSRNGATMMLRNALAQQKGLELLKRLRWLTEASVLQQSIMYGDYTAKLIMQELYDPATKSLNTDSKSMTSVKRQALEAMKTNPLLARNVVMLAMRRVIEDSLGASDKAESVRYRQTYYHLALKDFTGSQACNGLKEAPQKLGELFPGWKFGYWVTSEQKQADAALKDCPSEFQTDPSNPAAQYPEPGSGIGVSIADFYVLLPSPTVFSSGILEQPDSLRLALFYRDRLNQAIIDRTIGTIVKGVSGSGDDAEAIASNSAFALMNEGWGWSTRRKSPETIQAGK